MPKTPFTNQFQMLFKSKIYQMQSTNLIRLLIKCLCYELFYRFPWIAQLDKPISNNY